MIKLTASEVKADLLDIAAKHPDVIDRAGLYFADDDAPGCIVGQVLHKHGVTSEQVNDRDMNGAGFPTLTAHMLDTITYEEPAYRLLYIAQRNQDRYWPWGKTVTETITQVETEFGREL